MVPTFHMAAWGIMVDLVDAYFNVPISKDFQDYLAFVVDGEHTFSSAFLLAWPWPHGTSTGL